MGITGTGFFTQQPLPASAPILRFDPSIGDGHLLLVEPGASTSTLSGVPAADQVCDNLVEGEALRLLGLGLAARATVRPTFRKGANTGAAVFRMERTGLGGLHLIASQTADTEQTFGHFSAPEAIRQYILANSERRTASPTTGHRFAMFVWRRLTRQEITSGSYGGSLPHAEIGSSGGQSLGFNALTVNVPWGGGAITATGAGTAANLDPSANGLGVPLLRGGTMPALVDNATPTLATFYVHAGIGPFGSASNAVYRNASPSMVLYRWEVIDLTASGLSYLDAAQLNRREFDKAFGARGTVLPAFAYTQAGVARQAPALTLLADGRYCGDTVPTDPGTIA